MDRYGRQKRFGLRGQGTSDNARVGGAQQSDPFRFELRPEGIIHETFAHMGNNCYDACEEFYFPQMSACNSASGTSSPCPGYCSGFAVCEDYVEFEILEQSFFQCNQYTYYCNNNSVGDAFGGCIAGCTGGGYGGSGGGRHFGSGRHRKGGKIYRRRK